MDADIEAGTSCNRMELELVYPELKTHIKHVFKIRNGTYWTARRYAKSGFIKKRFIEECPFCRNIAPETIEHMLIKCSQWQALRADILPRYINIYRAQVATKPPLLPALISMRLVGKLLGEELKLSSTRICKDSTVLCVNTKLVASKLLNAITLLRYLMLNSIRLAQIPPNQCPPGYSLPFRYPESIFDVQRDAKILNKHKNQQKKQLIRKKKSKNKLATKNGTKKDVTGEISDIKKNEQINLDSKNESRDGSFISLEKKPSVNSSSGINLLLNVQMLITNFNAYLLLVKNQAQTLRNSKKTRNNKSVFHHKTKTIIKDMTGELFQKPGNNHLYSAESESIENLVELQISDTNTSANHEKPNTVYSNTSINQNYNNQNYTNSEIPGSYFDFEKNIKSYQNDSDQVYSLNTEKYENKSFGIYKHKKNFSIDAISNIDKSTHNNNVTSHLNSSGFLSLNSAPNVKKTAAETLNFYKNTRYTNASHSNNYSSSSDNYYKKSEFGYCGEDFTTSKIYGFDVKLLAQILSARTNQYSQFFQIGIDDITFLSYTPVESSIISREASAINKYYDKNGIISTNNSNTVDSDSKTKKFNFGGSTTRSNNSSQKSMLDISKPLNIKSQFNGLFADNLESSEMEFGKNSKIENLFSTSGAENKSNDDNLSRNFQSGVHVKKKPRFAFYVVLMMRENCHLTDDVQQKLYHCLLKPLSEAMKCEQENINWVYKESSIMRKIIKAAQREHWGIEKYWEELFKESELAKVLQTVYDNTLSMKCTHLMLNSNIPLSINVPPTPLILRQATNIPTAQAWYYFGAANNYKHSKPSAVKEFAERINSNDLKDAELIPVTYLKSLSDSKKNSDSNISLEAFFGESINSSKASISNKENLYGLGFELKSKESDTKSNDTDSNYSFDLEKSTHGINTFKTDFSNPYEPSSKKLISLVDDIKFLSLDATTVALSNLESDFPVFDSNPTKHINSFINKNEFNSRLSNTNYLENSYRVIGCDVTGSKHNNKFSTDKQSNIDSIIHNYNRLLASSASSNMTVFPLITNSNSLVSTSELFSLDNSLYPTIEPYHALLLLDDAESTLTRIGSDASPSLVRLILNATPTQQLAELHPLIDCSFAQICRLCAHLVYWGEARIICCVSINNIYMNRPKINLKDTIQSYENIFAKMFSNISLKKVLASLHLNQPFKDSLNSITDIFNTDSIMKSDTKVYENAKKTYIDPSNSVNPISDTKSLKIDTNKDNNVEKISNMEKIITTDLQKDENSLKQDNLNIPMLVKYEKEYNDLEFSNLQISNAKTKLADGFNKFKVKNLKNLNLLVGSVNYDQNREFEPVKDNTIHDSKYSEKEDQDDKLYQNILVFLLRNKLVVQKYVWPILLVPLFVKLGLSESKHTKLLKKQFKSSLMFHSHDQVDSFDLTDRYNSSRGIKTNSNNMPGTDYGKGDRAEMSGFMKNYYFSWRPTSGFSFASDTERSYLLKLTADKPQNLVPWFFNMTIYFNGKHHLDEILYREFLTLSQFERFIKPFEDLIIRTCHY
ncbi:hypothetical protein BB561_006790 [Smittium simulii]|uniref:GATOR1 complex protein NPRL3 C-terminal HTH domain-containing protein n=1 Tax=Smittium simulii TaxID=133385 RepID=A0A2T9Y1J1_9FUNG|nr:hypothetical protein BB561_006790 [Smittium simulii]